MPTLTEKIDSRELVAGERPSATLHYFIDGTASDLVARSTLLAGTPLVYDGLLRSESSVEPIVVDTTTDTGRWAGTVRYTAPQAQPIPVGGSTFSFDTAGGTQHITQSLETVASHAAPGLVPGAPNFRGAIGVGDAAGGVEGVDITVPVFNFTETHVLADATVTHAYRGTLFQLTGKVNSAPFKGLDAGECLFLGASGTKRADEQWELTFRFAASPNRTSITVGGMTGIAKKGWEYLWVRYADVEDQVSHTLVKQPLAAYIEKVYDEADFGALGIGV